MNVDGVTEEVLAKVSQVLKERGLKDKIVEEKEPDTQSALDFSDHELESVPIQHRINRSRMRDVNISTSPGDSCMLTRNLN